MTSARHAPLRIGAAALLAAGLTAAATTAPASAETKLKSLLFVNPLPKYPAWRLIGDCIAEQAKRSAFRRPSRDRRRAPWTRP